MLQSPRQRPIRLQHVPAEASGRGANQNAAGHFPITVVRRQPQRLAIRTLPRRHRQRRRRSRAFAQAQHPIRAQAQHRPQAPRLQRQRQSRVSRFFRAIAVRLTANALGRIANPPRTPITHRIAQRQPRRRAILTQQPLRATLAQDALIAAKVFGSVIPTAQWRFKSSTHARVFAMIAIRTGPRQEIAALDYLGAVAVVAAVVAVAAERLVAGVLFAR